MLNIESLNHKKTFERIVFVSRLSAIGDVIIASHTIAKLVKNEYFPVLITSPLTKDVALKIVGLNLFICYQKNTTPEFYIHGIKTDEKTFLNTLNNTVTKQKNIFIDLQKTARSKRSFKFLTKNLKIKFEKNYCVSKRSLYRFFLVFLSWLTFKQIKINKKNNVFRIHDIQENIIRKITKKDNKIFLSLNTNETQTLHKENSYYFENQKYICLFPGASGFIKSWPKEKFREIIKNILQETQLNIVICGSSNEKFIGEYLDFPANKRVLNLIDKTSLNETINVIANSKYVITNDSFAAHAADALHIPASVLFGATSPYFGFVPVFNKIHISYENLSCSPCSRHGKGSCRFKNLKCLQEIDSKKIFEKINTYIY
ncbi:glycosyltransferase family 9 protein [Silvanigrella aquatica]|uniref:Lipopolysaccharide heptosyltransferase II n=1 Tax=Silvanigrella aquatica TaxID=1915309 RepID=A0A1L4CXY8_9BACT|nr:glycosyltransferase family 9 protein [Silvanigrella aquatica]APJ02821.1 hypothetical protein AXG55_02350 [Silvanigrella aquatica]